MSYHLQESIKAEIQSLLDKTKNPENIYQKVLDEVERPMLEIVMRWAYGNQTKAASALGINRSTLRGKLKRHNLL